MNTQTETAQLFPTQDTTETIPAAVITYQRHEDIAQDITSRYPHAEAVIMRGLENAHTVQMESGQWETSRRELSGHRMATVNGHAVRKAQRGGSKWNSPPAWDTLACSCESYEYSSGTATITKPTAWDVDPTAPKSHDHKICKHIAAYAIVKQDGIELKAAADEADEALAAGLFTSVDTGEAETTTAETYLNGITHTTTTGTDGIIYHAETVNRTHKHLRSAQSPQIIREWTSPPTMLVATKENPNPNNL